MDTKKSVRKEASEWLVSIHSRDWSASDEQLFNAWLARSDFHRSTYHEMQEIWQNVPVAASLRSIKSIKKEQEKPFFALYAVMQNFKYQLAFTLCCFFLVSFVVWRQIGVSSVEWKMIRSAVAENKHVELSDGSTVILGGASEIRWRANQHSREVILVSGQAFFDVAKDSQRPFNIEVGRRKVKVVGTQFDVRKYGSNLKVAVLEGHVRVETLVQSRGAPTLNQRSLFSGDSLEFRGNASEGEMTKISLDDLASWKDGRFVYRNADLQDVIQDVQRYYTGHIDFYGKDLKTLKVTTSFSLDQIDTMSFALEKILPIKIIRDDKGDLLIVNDT